MPRVSVVMPVFNGKRHVNGAITSLLAEDYEDFELIAVDDGSTDGTPEILRRRAANDPRIVVLRQENRGIAEALNAGMAVARGEYIARLDADDLHVNRLRRQVELLDRERDVVLVSTWFDLFDDDERPAGSYRVAEPPAVTRWLLNFYNVLGGHAQVMFRRDAALAAGGYRAAFSIAEDYDLWTRLLDAGRIVVLPFTGLRRRRHAAAAGVTQQERQEQSSDAVMRRTLSSYLQRELSESEAAGVTTLWRGGFEPEALGDAERVCREAFERLAREAPQAQSRVRFLTGRRWCLLAARCLRRGRAFHALRCVVRGTRWHPLALAAAIAAVLRSGAAAS